MNASMLVQGDNSGRNVEQFSLGDPHWHWGDSESCEG